MNQSGENDSEDCQCAFHRVDDCSCEFHCQAECNCDFHRLTDDGAECPCPYHAAVNHLQIRSAQSDVAEVEECCVNSLPTSDQSSGGSSLPTVNVGDIRDLQDDSLSVYANAISNQHSFSHEASTWTGEHLLSMGAEGTDIRPQGGDEELREEWSGASTPRSTDGLQCSTSSHSSFGPGVMVHQLEPDPYLHEDIGSASGESSIDIASVADSNSSESDDDLDEDAAHLPGIVRNAAVIGSSDDSDNPDDPDAGGHPNMDNALNVPLGPDDSDPSDPDDSHDSDIFDDSEDGDHSVQNVTIRHENLNAPVQFFEGCTVRETVAMVIALSVRKNEDYQTTMEQFSILNMVTGLQQFPTDKRQLWRLLGLNKSGVRKHAYCWQCQRSLGRVRNLQPGTRCCGVLITPRNVKYFITLPLKRQIQRILDRPGAADQLSFRETRVKKAVDAIEDIYDGAGYVRLMAQENGLQPPYDYSYVANFDGFSVSKSSKNEGWGLMVRLNEFKPNLRQKNVILCAFWLDTKAPRYDLFLRKFVAESNRLAADGIMWKPDGVNEVRTRIFPTVFPLDAIARCGALRMTQFNGLYGCTFCEHPGVSVDHVWKYPLPGTAIIQHTRQGDREVVVPQNIPLRTHEGLQEIMAMVGPNRVLGVIEPSELADLDFFDLGRGFSTDDLHPIYVGVAAFHTELLLRLCGNMAEAGRVINARFIKMQMPSVISRKPRLFTERGNWKGTEWRNWLLYAAVPCLQGLVAPNHITHYGMLSTGAFIASRDVITQAQLHEARQIFTEYQRLMQQYHGPESMRFVVHELGHVMDCVENWGNMWCQSTFPFESKNHWLKKRVTSPRAVADQVVDRYLLMTLAEGFQHRDDISEDVKNKVTTLLNPWTPKNKRMVGNVLVFGVGEARNLTQEEVALMEEENIAGHLQAEVHEHIKVNSCECRPHHHSISIKSNDSLIYTTDDLFYEIQTIVVYGDEPNRHVGLFCKLLHTGNPLNGVFYIMEVEDMEEEVFVAAEDVRNSAMKITVQNRTYIMPMPHQNDID